MRIAHGNPILGAANSIIRGNITPPSPPAVQAMPVAKPRRMLNQCPTHETAGVNNVQAESPPRTLKDKKI